MSVSSKWTMPVIGKIEDIRNYLHTLVREIKTTIEAHAEAINGISTTVVVRNGCILSNDSGDTAHDINITVGYRASETDFETGMSIASEITKRIDAAWAVGDDNGGLDTGSVAADTTYHLWLISNGISVDALFSTSVTSPTMPSGYTLKARLGAAITDGSSNILGFIQTGPREFWLKAHVQDVNTTLSTTPTNYALTVPSGISVEAFIYVRRTQYAYIYHPDLTDVAATIYNQSNIQANIPTDTSSQVRAVAASSATFIVYTAGWNDASLQ